MRRIWSVVIACGALVGAVAGASPAESEAGAVVTPIESAQWAPVFADHPEGPAISVAWGNVKKGPVGLLLKFPAGFATPNHVHSSDYRGVVVSGEFSHQAGNDAAVALGPGSTWSQRAKLPHVNKCSDAGACVVYVMAAKGFDFTAVK